MLNEYGEKLDRNGYAPSILQMQGCEPYCYLCLRNGGTDPINRHEVFGGPFRQKSKRLGLWCYLCHNSCHQGTDGVHNNREKELELKRRAQQAAMDFYGWSVEDFIREFGKNYLEV